MGAMPAAENSLVEPPPSRVLVTLVTEALDKVASPSARDAIVKRALETAERQTVPTDADHLQAFVAGPLRSAVSQSLGADVADALVEDLMPLVRRLFVQADTVPPPPVAASASVGVTHVISEQPRQSGIRKTPSDPAIAQAVAKAADASPVAAQRRRATVAYASAADASKLLVLVDDDAPFLSGLRRLLEAEGYEVMVAPDGSAALHLCKRLRPQLVITDLEMPGMDGIQLAEKLEIELGEHAPAVALLTGKSTVPANPPWIARVFLKSAQPRELLDEIAQLVERRRSNLTPSPSP
jgi:CheY-like chemotaxis protein